MSSNPLSYESLKTVMQYMEANLRYDLTSRIPSIRTVEKLIPLKFDTLEFDRLQTRVNRTTYRLRVIRQYHDGEEIPKDHETKNANGGIPHDIIVDGFEALTFTGDATPGDVEIHYPNREGYPWLQNIVFDEEQYLLERHIEIYEKAVTMKLEQSEDLSIARGEGEAIVSHRFLQEITDPIENQRAERKLLKTILPLSVEQLREKIQYFHACLIPYRCRRDNTPLPFTPLIQLTVESPTGVQVYRHIHLKLHQAMKKINTALFGGRKCLIRSRSLNIAEPLIVLRLPEGVRVRIRELSVSGDVASNYEALKTIVEETSYPLDSMTITDQLLYENQYEHSIVKSSEILLVKPNRPLYIECLQHLLPLKNKAIHIDCIRWRFPVEDQIRLVEHWLNDDKHIGTSLTYDIEGRNVVKRLLSQLSLRSNGIRQTVNMVVMPMNNGNSLKVSYASIEQPDSQDEHQKFRVEMKVVAEIRVETETATWKIFILCLHVSRILFLGSSVF